MRCVHVRTEPERGQPGRIFGERPGVHALGPAAPPFPGSPITAGRLRWTAAGMLEAEAQFRKIIGYQHLAALAIAVERDLAAQHSLTATPALSPRPTTTTTAPAATLATAPDHRTATAKLHGERDNPRRRRRQPQCAAREVGLRARAGRRSERSAPSPCALRPPRGSDQDGVRALAGDGQHTGTVGAAPDLVRARLPLRRPCGLAAVALSAAAAAAARGCAVVERSRRSGPSGSAPAALLPSRAPRSVLGSSARRHGP